MNRKQRRISKHNKNPYAAAQAQFESELRNALKDKGVQLVTASTGHDQEGTPTWVLQVKRDAQTWMLRAPNKAIPVMVKQILARMNGEVEPELPPVGIATESKAQPAPTPITTNAPGNGAPATEHVVVHTEDLSHYLDTDLKL